MPDRKRDGIFISYSHQDREIYKEIRQKLLDRNLGDVIRDDRDIRPSDQWDPRIQGMMDKASVAILVLSDHFFRRRDQGDNYILEKELPYLLEHYRKGEMDLLLLYWSPSPHFAPEQPDRVSPFRYVWEGRDRSYDLHRIQALVGNGRLASADEQDRLDLLLDLAWEAERRLDERRTREGQAPEPASLSGRRVLTVELSVDGAGVHRAFRVGGQPIRASLPGIPRAQIADIQAYAGISLPSEDDRAQLGNALYRLLFGAANSEAFPQLAQAAWDLPPGSEANTLSVQAEIHCDAMTGDPWPLDLPWNLTAFRGASLAAHCGWSFEVAPPEVTGRFGQILSPEPPLLLLFDEGADGAKRHAGHLNQYLDHAFGFSADVRTCGAIDQVADRVSRAPEPEILYAYGPTSLDLQGLARALGNAVPLVVLNLIGEKAPMPPAELVRNRKLILCVHGAVETDQARNAGHHWLQGFQQAAIQTPVQRTAIDAFGPRVCLWSGCAGLETPIAQAGKGLFRRPLIKLLLDRVTARREVSDEVATALGEDKGILGLVAAGTPDDHPGLLPRQVWHHYEHVREAASRDAIRRQELSAGPIPEADELLYRLAVQLGASVDDWEDALDRDLGETQPGERMILSLEWQLPKRPAEEDAAAWRSRWLEAWFRLGTETLSVYHKQGVLMAHFLLVEAVEAAEAEAWCREARDLYRQQRRALSPSGRRFVHHFLAPLSQVPVDDIERFLDVHYRLPEYHPELDPFAVAQWVHARTGGVFSRTVDEMEKLHDTGFREAYAALEAGAL